MRKIADQLFRGARIGFVSMLVKKHEADQLDRGGRAKQIGNSANGDLRGGMYRISESPGGDGREAYAGTSVAIGLFQSVAIAAFQDLGLVAVAALPYRSNGVDHVVRFQARSGGGNGLAWG